jgi:hypothetical protein
MDHQEKDEIAIATKESRIDCQIRNIKASFNLQTFFSMYTKRKAASDYSLSEFGFGVSNLGVLAVRHYLWLSIKLMALHVAKLVNWLIHHR